jgi:hypothetical protein
MYSIYSTRLQCRTVHRTALTCLVAYCTKTFGTHPSLYYFWAVQYLSYCFAQYSTNPPRTCSAVLLIEPKQSDSLRFTLSSTEQDYTWWLYSTVHQYTKSQKSLSEVDCQICYIVVAAMCSMVQFLDSSVRTVLYFILKEGSQILSVLYLSKYSLIWDCLLITLIISPNVVLHKQLRFECRESLSLPLTLRSIREDR